MDTETDTQREDGCVKMEPEMGVMWLPTSQGMPRSAGNHQKLGGGKEGFFPRAFRGGKALHLDFGLLASRAMRE